jgi:UDP-glucuronate 4-epimerase
MSIEKVIFVRNRKKMNYLVTGGSGFIGSHLVEKLLREGHSVINVDNFDNFYDYQIKVQNTLESVGDNSAFDFDHKLTDIAKLIDRTKSEQYRLYYQDIRDKEDWKRSFRSFL